jgi:hypothetical protein
MLLDYYTQIDKIKCKYDKLQKCIEKLDKSILIPKTGFLKSLDDYYNKLILIINTRDTVLRQIMDIIKLANLVHEDVRAPFGLAASLEEWQCRLNCIKPKAAEDDDCDDSDDADTVKPTPCMDQDNSCILYPQLTFPIKKDPYTKWIWSKYDYADKTELPTATTDYLQASKEKEAIEACINSLTEAVAVANPKDRCK